MEPPDDRQDGQPDEVRRELAELRRAHDIPTSGAVAYVVLAFAAAALALWAVWPLLTGPTGMVLGLIAHVKGHRLGIVAAVVAGIATVVGLALALLFFNPSGG